MANKDKGIEGRSSGFTIQGDVIVGDYQDMQRDFNEASRRSTAQYRGRP